MTVSYRTQVSDFSATIVSSPFTIIALDIGTATATRVVALAIHIVYTAVDVDHDNPTAVTIGGISATKAVGLFDNSLADISSSIWSAVVPTGTTADVVVTLPGDVSGGISYGAGSWALDAVSATASDTASDSDFNTSPSNLNCDVVNGSAIVASTFNVNGVFGGGITATWTGATENFDADWSSGIVGGSGASLSAGGTETPRTIEAAWPNPALVFAFGVAAVWPPEVGSVVMAANVGSFALTGNAAAFAASMAAAAGSFVLTGQDATLTAEITPSTTRRPLFRRGSNTYWRGMS